MLPGTSTTICCLARDQAKGTLVVALQGEGVVLADVQHLAHHAHGLALLRDVVG